MLCGKKRIYVTVESARNKIAQSDAALVFSYAGITRIRFKGYISASRKRWEAPQNQNTWIIAGNNIKDRGEEIYIEKYRIIYAIK